MRRLSNLKKELIGRRKKDLISGNSGLTVLEMVIVLSLVSIVIFLGYNVFGMMSNTFDSEENLAIVQQNVRIGSDFISGDVRYASEMEILSEMPQTPDTRSRYIYINGNSLIMKYNGVEKNILKGNDLGITLQMSFQRQSEYQTNGSTSILCYELKATGGAYYGMETSVLIEFAAGGIVNSAGLNPGRVIRYKLAPNANLITSYKFMNIGGKDYSGVIDQVAKTIKVVMPEGTSVTSLVATYVTEGITVKVGTTVQESGVTANNFTTPVTYTVIAETGPSANYTVSVVFKSPGAYVRIILPEDKPLPTTKTVLTGAYTYFANGLDAEGDSDITWRRLDANGQPTIVLANDTMTYTPTGLAGKVIVFGVRPKTVSGVQAVDFIYSAPKLIFGEAKNPFWDKFVNDAYYNFLMHDLASGRELTNAEMAALGLPLNYIPAFLLRNDMNIISKLIPDINDVVMTFTAKIGNSQKGVKISTNMSGFVEDFNSYTVTVDAQMATHSGWDIMLNASIDTSNKNKDTGYMFQVDPEANGFCVRRVTSGTHNIKNNVGAIQTSGIASGASDGAPYSPIFLRNSNFLWSGTNNKNNPNWLKRMKTEITTQVQCDGSLRFRVRLIDFIDNNGVPYASPKYSNYIWFGDFGTITVNGPSNFNGVKLPSSDEGGFDPGVYLGVGTWHSGGGDFGAIFNEILLSQGFALNVTKAEFSAANKIKIDFDQQLAAVGNISAYNISFRDVNALSAILVDSDTIEVTLATDATQYDLLNGALGQLKIERGAVKMLHAGDVEVTDGLAGIDVQKLP